MVLFLVLSVPLAYLFILQFQAPFGDMARQLRNPLVIGAAGFFLYALGASFFWPLFSTEYRWSDAFLMATISDQILPFGSALILFRLFFRKSWNRNPEERAGLFFSFLAAFLFILSIRDLTVSINELGPVELFYRPMGRICLLIILPWIVNHGRWNSAFFKILLVDLFVVHLLIGLACAEQKINQPLWATILMLVPVAEAILLIGRRGRIDSWLGRKHPA